MRHKPQSLFTRTLRAAPFAVASLCTAFPAAANDFLTKEHRADIKDTIGNLEAEIDRPGLNLDALHTECSDLRDLYNKNNVRSLELAIKIVYARGQTIQRNPLRLVAQNRQEGQRITTLQLAIKKAIKGADRHIEGTSGTADKGPCDLDTLPLMQPWNALPIRQAYPSR